MSTVLVTGATGFVGRQLVKRLLADDVSVIALSRNEARARLSLPEQVTIHQWHASDVPPTSWFENVDAVIHLAGDNVADGRWTAAKKQRILDSRVRSTESIVAAIGACEQPPALLLSASGVGYYGDCGDRDVDETAPVANDFLASVCRDWEAAACGAESHGVRVVRLRVGFVLGDGGALSKMLLPFRLGLGGPLGHGRQWVSWIHIDDLVGIILHAMTDSGIKGPVNGVGPNPVSNRELTKTLGRVLGRPAVLPAPAFAIRLVLGEFADAVLTGQKVNPKAALTAGYSFQYESLELALRAVLD